MPADTPNRASMATNAIYRFADFEVRAESGEIFRNGERVRVQEQSLQVLLALLENSGGLVSRDQLRERLWPEGTYVDFEHSLNAAVKRLRAALGDDADSPLYVETLPRRGYRLIVDVETTPQASRNNNAVTSRSTPSSETSLPHQPFIAKRTLIGVAVLLILMAGSGILFLSRRGEHTFFRGKPSSATAFPPQNSEAYELYLRGLSYKYEFPENSQAIALLERSTALDPNSARSWYELARRYDIEFINAARGRGFLELSREANRRALQLAPEFSPARLEQVMLDVQEGQLIPAYHSAVTMAQDDPNDANAHFALAYTLRHGGMFQDAALECEHAIKLDPSNALFRPCALINELLGNHDRALVFANLDPLSSNARFRRMELAILRNDNEAALQEARSIRAGPRAYPDARLMEGALSGAPLETMRTLSQEAEAINDRITLPELHFVDARYQSWAGQPEAALRLLRRAIANNYCSYPVMDSDPFFANLRKLPEYKELRDLGIACRENFRSHLQK